MPRMPLLLRLSLIRLALARARMAWGITLLREVGLLQGGSEMEGVRTSWYSAIRTVVCE